MNRILIAGTHSGCGKTTITCAVLKALKNRGLKVSAFKCGPDYIDPLFHRKVIGVPSHNLDPFFCNAEQLKRKLSAEGTAVCEGVMGYYDGAGPGGAYSTYNVAKNTQTPVVLVVDAKGMYASAGAVIKGFLEYKRDNKIAGVIFNNAPPSIYTGLAELAASLGVKPLGLLPKDTSIAINSRHLGLNTDSAVNLDKLAELAEKYICLKGLLELAESAPALNAPPIDIKPLGSVRIAVSRDEAFCFMYEENIELMRKFGAEIVFFSPLHDKSLPENIGGLYLCGGYPELHEHGMDLWGAINAGLPTIAECGGFMYLYKDTVFKTERLQRFGYVTLTANRDNLLCKRGENIRAHEFHYWDCTDCGSDFTARKPVSEENPADKLTAVCPSGRFHRVLSKKSWECVHATETLWAGFPHLYFDANPKFCENFIRKAIN
ncbi:MAG: cobyrinate a,c-diamide synthase [Clostridiales bacterium]|jgi:cobyrinic acid a,c-diamide synthase|nr:cobyrinate a,c-diamide synthase [Clostridiales bacterium]